MGKSTGGVEGGGGRGRGKGAEWGGKKKPRTETEVEKKSSWKKTGWKTRQKPILETLL